MIRMSRPWVVRPKCTGGVRMRWTSPERQEGGGAQGGIPF
jgi:hypothetical protein